VRGSRTWKALLGRWCKTVPDLNLVLFYLPYIGGACFAVFIIALLVMFAMYLRRWVQPTIDKIAKPIIDANVLAAEDRWCGKCGKRVTAKKTRIESAGSWFIVNFLFNGWQNVGFTYVDTEFYCPDCGTKTEEPKTEEQVDRTADLKGGDGVNERTLER
jgi:hypothetical protein